MSHFAVLVVTDKAPTSEVLIEAMAPFHEFECTGVDDQYIQEVDAMADNLASFERWGKNHYPDFKAYITADYEDKVLGPRDKPDRAGAHKYGWVRLNEQGEVVEVIRRTNPNAKWDWWALGGRYQGLLLNKDGEQTDCCRKGDLDFEGLRLAAETEAAARWDKVRALTGDALAEFVPWPEMRDRWPNDIDLARKAYHDQAAIKALRADNEAIWYNLEDYLISREEYIRQAGASSFQLFAFLREGVWAERGEMGWFATVSNERDDWPEVFQSLVAEVPDNYWFSVVDCHI